MGLQAPHVLPRQERVYVTRESTPLTFNPPVAVSAIKTLKLDMKPAKRERKTREDRRQTRSLQERFNGRIEVPPYSIECYALPSAVAGTPPDIHDLLLCAWGTYANVPATSDTYTPTDTQGAQGAFSLVRETSALEMRANVGSWVDVFKIAMSGGAEPRFTFEGGSADQLFTAYTTLNGGVSGGANSIVVTDGDNLENGSIVNVGTSTNHTLSAKSGATFTVTPVIVGAQANGAAVTPYVPSETTAGSPLTGIDGGITLGGVELPYTEFNFELKNNIAAFNDRGGRDKVHDWVEGFREVTGDFTVRASRDQLIHLGRYKNSVQTTRALVVTCGNVAGRRFVLTMNNIEYEVPDFDDSQQTAMIKCPWVAFGTSGADEASMAWT